MQGYRFISKKKIAVWLIYRIIGLFIVTGLCTGVYFLFREIAKETGTEQLMIIAYVSISISMVCMLIYTFIMPSLQHRAWIYKIEQDKIEVRRGVITKTVEIVPESRIQHISVIQAIPDRLFSLASVIVTTASSSVTIIGLPRETAEQIAEEANKGVNRIVREEDPK